MLHRGQHGKNADAVGDEVGCVLGADHALAQRGGEERFEGVQQRGFGLRRRDDFDQVHVAGRVEEMDAAESRPQRGRDSRRQRGERKARRVGREDRLRRQMRGNIFVEVALPVEALSDGFDHEVAFGEPCEIAAIIRGLDRIRAILRAQRRGLELGEARDRLGHQAVRITFLGRKVEQQDGDIGVGEVRGDLRAHHAGAEYGNLADEER